MTTRLQLTLWREFMYFRVVYTPSAESRWKVWNRQKAAKFCRFSVLDGVHTMFWWESRIWTGTLVNFCRRKLSGETLCKVVQIFPPKDLVYFFKFFWRLLLVYFSITGAHYPVNKYYIIFCIEGWIKTFKRKTSVVLFYWIAFGVSNSIFSLRMKDMIDHIRS